MEGEGGRTLDASSCLAIWLLFGVTAAGLWCLVHVVRGPGLVRIEVAAPLEQRLQVDVNTAPWPELTVLPGIGETLARRIVASRQQQGRFDLAADLLRVRGIGPKKLAQMRPYLHFDRAPPSRLSQRPDRPRRTAGGRS